MAKSYLNKKLVSNKIKVSIIVPVYNTEKYLRDCMEGLINQTLREIEVICIDDCSSDGSLAILKEYANADTRVKIIEHTENLTANVSRIEGVEAASGEYILFVDSDDILEITACEKLYNKVRNAHVDILHFGSIIQNNDDLPKNRIVNMEKFVAPYLGELHGQEVFDGCFRTDKYHFTLWNKMYRANVVKRAFYRLKKCKLPKAQDKYAYLSIAIEAQSYLGIEEKFYTYNFGNGLTGHNTLTLDEFEIYATMGATSKQILKLLEEADRDYNDVGKKSSMQLAMDCVANFFRLNEIDRSAGFDAIFKYFDPAYGVSAFTKTDWFNIKNLAKDIKNSDVLKCSNKQIKTIATYYHKLECGGVQRVLVYLVHQWIKMGYRVIVLTDTEPCEGDYCLPDGAERVVIPSFFVCNKENYFDRACELERIIYDYGIDTVVYHAWISNLLIWDALLFKLNNVKFIVHCHSIFSMAMMNSRIFWGNLPYIYSIVDGIITLSNVDTEFWSNFNNNVFQTLNPLPEYKYVAKKENDNFNIIWSGRFSEEKRPIEAIEIFIKVHDKMPNAKLFVLGKGTTNKFLNEMNKIVKEFHIEDSVCFFGYQKNLQMFYDLASVSLVTSEYEGFPLTIAESLSAGVPVVMYDLPYLYFSEQGKGIVSVEFGNKDAAADALITVMTDYNKKSQLTAEGIETINKVNAFDFETFWRNVFAKVESENWQGKKVSLMWDTLLSHYKMGAIRENNKAQIDKKKIDELSKQLQAYDGQLLKKYEKLKEDYSSCQKEKAKLFGENEKVNLEREQLNYELTEIRKSFTYRVAMALTWLPRKLRK